MRAFEDGDTYSALVRPAYDPLSDGGSGFLEELVGADVRGVQVTPLPKQKLDVSKSQDSAAKSIATAKREVRPPLQSAMPAKMSLESQRCAACPP